jgi:cyclic pyranopterin phosphate synthase
MRCTYCMPAEGMTFFDRSEILTFEEIVRFVRIAAPLGITDVRLTGGEPLVRQDLHVLVRQIAGVRGIRDIGITTNGILLAEQARDLYDAGLRRINVSLDSLDPGKFAAVTRRDAFHRVLAGLEEAVRVGMSPVKINTIAVRGFTDEEILAFAELAREKPYEVRFIEYMPLGADDVWENHKVLSQDEILARIREVWPLEPIAQADARAPADTFRFLDGRGTIGVIASVTHPFCESCDRIRITADGKLRTCLFSIHETDIKPLLRGGAPDSEIRDILLQAVWNKEPGHRIGQPDFVKPPRTMSAIGG